MEMQNIVQRTQSRAGDRKLHVTLSPAALCLVAVGIVLVLGWCFYMGFMIGRGQNPEEHLQKIAALWQQEAGDKAVPGQPGTFGQAGQAQPGQTGQEGTAQPAAGAAPQGGAAGQPAQPGASQPGFVPGTVPGFPTFTTPGQPAQAPTAQAQPQAKPQAQPEKEPARADEPYTFVYRMATVRTQSDARSEQARYESRGFRVSIRRLGSSWALQYTFKGTDEDCARFLQSVKKAGLGEPLRISRKKN